MKNTSKISCRYNLIICAVWVIVSSVIYSTNLIPIIVGCIVGFAVLLTLILGYLCYKAMAKNLPIDPYNPELLKIRFSITHEFRKKHENLYSQFLKEYSSTMARNRDDDIFSKN
jgi:hypothetical protein